MYRIKHQWLGYLTELSPNNTTFDKNEAGIFSLRDAADYIDSRDANFFYTLERVN